MPPPGQGPEDWERTERIERLKRSRDDENRRRQQQAPEDPERTERIERLKRSRENREEGEGPRGSAEDGTDRETGKDLGGG